MTWYHWDVPAVASTFADYGIEERKAQLVAPCTDPQCFELPPGCTAAAWPLTHRHTAMPPPYALEAPASIMCSLQCTAKAGMYVRLVSYRWHRLFRCSAAAV